VATVRGRVRLTTDGVDAPIDMQAGDVVILNGRSWAVIEGGPGLEPAREIAVSEADPFIQIGGADYSMGDNRLTREALSVVRSGPRCVGSQG
jgi:hypothetical protein